jgi:oxygen-independent coproporphyrinogen-3 oxidase
VSGIYIHIPFCKKACHYCDFHFSTTLKSKGYLVDALCSEIEQRKNYLDHKEIETLYFGGGTPSLLSKDELEKILQTVNKYFNLKKDVEITLEANPDDLDISKLKELKSLGINRLSIGIQSFFDEDLSLMNRSHTSKQAIKAVKDAQKTGFKNITIDLIYGLPDLSLTLWKENLKKAFELDVPHISAYNLTVEKKTALNHLVESKKVKLPEESLVIEQFNTLIEETQKHGFIHYEISNFCKEGMNSRHNTSYWKDAHYVGIGPSAHSYNGTSRQWNISNNAAYVKSVNSGALWFEEEKLTEEDKFNEYVMTRLRTVWGIDLGFVKKSFGEKNLQNLISLSSDYISSGHILRKEESIILTRKGKLLADKIASDFFI